MPWKWFIKLRVLLKVFWFQQELRELDLEEFYLCVCLSLNFIICFISVCVNPHISNMHNKYRWRSHRVICFGVFFKLRNKLFRKCVSNESKRKNVGKLLLRHWMLCFVCLILHLSFSFVKPQKIKLIIHILKQRHLLGINWNFCEISSGFKAADS